MRSNDMSIADEHSYSKYMPMRKATSRGTNDQM
jgi:hypothetical protein